MWGGAWVPGSQPTCSGRQLHCCPVPFSPLTLEPSKGYQSFSKGVQAFPHTDPQVDFASSSTAPQKYLYYVPRGNSSFAQSRKLVSVALDTGQICIDQNEDFSRFLDRRKKKGLATPAKLGIWTSTSCPSPGQGTSASRACTALWNWARGQNKAIELRAWAAEPAFSSWPLIWVCLQESTPPPRASCWPEPSSCRLCALCGRGQPVGDCACLLLCPQALLLGCGQRRYHDKWHAFSSGWELQETPC